MMEYNLFMQDPASSYEIKRSKVPSTKFRFVVTVSLRWSIPNIQMIRQHTILASSTWVGYPIFAKVARVPVGRRGGRDSSCYNLSERAQLDVEM